MVFGTEHRRTQTFADVHRRQNAVLSDTLTISSRCLDLVCVHLCLSVFPKAKSESSLFVGTWKPFDAGCPLGGELGVR
jgi:hypothetical protein